MSRMMRTLGIAFIAVAMSLGAVGVASAQDEPPELPENCASCESCTDCDRSPWGALFCDFGGTDPKDPDKGCCRLRGGICNPAFALNLDAGDMQMVPTVGDGEGLVVVRLAGNVFGTWGCDDGELEVAYRVTDDGAFHSLPDEELKAYRLEYSLTQYVSILNDRLREAGQET